MSENEDNKRHIYHETPPNKKQKENPVEHNSKCVKYYKQYLSNKSNFRETDEIIKDGHDIQQEIMVFSCEILLFKLKGLDFAEFFEDLFQLDGEEFDEKYEERLLRKSKQRWSASTEEDSEEEVVREDDVLEEVSEVIVVDDEIQVHRHFDEILQEKVEEDLDAANYAKKRAETQAERTIAIRQVFKGYSDSELVEWWKGKLKMHKFGKKALKVKRESTLDQKTEPETKLESPNERKSNRPLKQKNNIEVVPEEDMIVDLDLKIFNLWKREEMTDEVIRMLVDLEDLTPHFAFGLNLAAHFLDDPTVQMLYEEQDDPRGISLQYLQDVKNAMGKKGNTKKNIEFMQFLQDLAKHTENEYIGQLNSHLQKPPKIVFGAVDDGAIGVFSSDFPDQITINRTKLERLCTFPHDVTTDASKKKRYLLTVALYIGCTIVHEISHWKMFHFGKHYTRHISPTKYMIPFLNKTISKNDRIDSGYYLERHLFGGCVALDNMDQLFFIPIADKSSNGKPSSKYIHLKSYLKFFSKDWWTQSHNLVDFHLVTFEKTDPQARKKLDDDDLPPPTKVTPTATYWYCK
jgi:hypothetical protein